MRRYTLHKYILLIALTVFVGHYVISVIMWLLFGLVVPIIRGLGSPNYSVFLHMTVPVVALSLSVIGLRFLFKRKTITSVIILVIVLLLSGITFSLEVSQGLYQTIMPVSHSGYERRYYYTWWWFCEKREVSCNIETYRNTSKSTDSTKKAENNEKSETTSQ
jgi:hypothetical protein